MAKWTVRIPYYADVLVRVEAETEQQALEKAERSVHPRLCHHCNRDIEIGETDFSGEWMAEKESA